MNEATSTTNIRSSRQHLVRNYLLLWIDSSVDEESKDYQEAFVRLKNVVNNVNRCTQPDQCIKYLLDKVDNQCVFVITSGYLGQYLIPKIHDISQLESIYICCGNKSKHQQWAKDWTKIKGVYTNMNEICQVLQLAIRQCDQEHIAISFVKENEINSTHNLNELEPTFMYTQIFKEILLDIDYNDKNRIQNLATCCREIFYDNSMELQVINEFEHDYVPEKAIWWYTRECFTYKMLNQALRTLNADIIINMGFFLRDVHRQIQEMYEEQVGSLYNDKSFVVYRGQGFLKSNFDKLQETKGGLISFNNFLSTSTNEQVSLSFARDASTKPNMIGILFIMTIDPRSTSTPFASIRDESYFKGEDEILFSMHTVFRIGTIQQIDSKTQLYQVDLQLTLDDDQELRSLTERLWQDMNGTGWEILGDLLLKIGQFTKADEFYNVLLEQASNVNEKSLYNNQLGLVHLDQGDYEKALFYFKQGLKIRQETLPLNHPHLAISYNNIGLVYDKMGEYKKALGYYRKDLEISRKCFPSNHPSLATLYNNIGLVNSNMEEYEMALSCYEQALEIREEILPSNHPDLANVYNNIGLVYDQLKKYEKALLFHEKALKIREKALPPNHPDIGVSYNNIGLIYRKMEEYEKALLFYKKDLEISQKSLPSNHPHLATSYNNIGWAYRLMEDYSNALEYFQRSLDIRQHSLPSTHPSIIKLKESIEFVKQIKPYSFIQTNN